VTGGVSMIVTNGGLLTKNSTVAIGVDLDLTFGSLINGSGRNITIDNDLMLGATGVIDNSGTISYRGIFTNLGDAMGNPPVDSDPMFP